MWMMMDSAANDINLTADPIISRKLRPLMPRPTTTTIYSNPSCSCIRNPNILSWNHSHSISDHGVKREIQTAAPLVSTRWNPTPEQLQALEEMYRRGIRTPSAEQIQQIAAKLGRFGKIEGKNVFYWFQNHKARERQKKRRQLELLAAKNMRHLTNHQTGLSRRCLEIETDKKEPIPSNCSTPSSSPSPSPSPSPSEDSASMHGAVIAAAEISGKDHKELQHNVATATAENETCWPLQLHLHLSSPSPSPSPSPSIIQQPTGQENTIASPRHQRKHKHKHKHKHIHDHEAVEDRTLNLFPTPRARREEDAPHSSTLGTKIMPSRFIEFLPIKESKEGSVY